MFSKKRMFGGGGGGVWVIQRTKSVEHGEIYLLRIPCKNIAHKPNKGVSIKYRA